MSMMMVKDGKRRGKRTPMLLLRLMLMLLRHQTVRTLQATFMVQLFPFV